MKIKEYQTFPSLINDKKELETAIEDFGCNICKGSKRLKNDKELILKAIDKDPTTVLYLDEKLKSDPDIKSAIERKDSELVEVLDPISELMKEKNPDELSLLVQSRDKILYNYLHPEQEEVKAPTYTSVERPFRKKEKENDQVLGG